MGERLLVISNVDEASMAQTDGDCGDQRGTVPLWNGIPDESHRYGQVKVQLDALAKVDELQEAGATCKEMRAAYRDFFKAFPEYGGNRAQRRAVATGSVRLA
jgi:hypothetical protein